MQCVLSLKAEAAFTSRRPVVLDMTLPCAEWWTGCPTIETFPARAQGAALDSSLPRRLIHCRGGSLHPMMSRSSVLTSTCCRRPHVLLGVSGSVAAIKVPLIAELLARFADVQIITTDAARRLIPAEFLASTLIPVRGRSKLAHTSLTALLPPTTGLDALLKPVIRGPTASGVLQHSSRLAACGGIV